MKKSVLQWLEKTVQKYPDKVAFDDGNNTITFSQIQYKAKKIGTALCKTVNSNTPVAVLSGRHIMTPVTFLGVLYSGCFYAPLDSTAPVYRLNQILKNLEPSVIITDSENVSLAQSLDCHAKILNTDELLKYDIDDDLLYQKRRYAKINDPLYVIYTSGSSGVPKGVITSHQSLMCYIDAYSKALNITENDVFGCQSPLDYIAAIRDIYLPLKHGAQTIIIPKQYFSVPVKLFDIMNEKKITSIGWSVSALTLPTSMGVFEHSKPKYLKKVCFSGSVMPCRYLKIWQENLPDTVFVNQYGPTEATASCTYYTVKETVNESDSLPIGKPYDNYGVFLLDENNNPVKNGEIGEICVTGPILALGYYNDPVRTKASFIQNPLNPYYDERMYKTGDLGLFNKDNNLEFHGRKDRQIKHLGHRVELDEIEENVKNINGIEECAALYYKEIEQIFLIYSGLATSKEIAVELRKKIPGFMVPRKFINVEQLPHLPNGKIDMQKINNDYLK